MPRRAHQRATRSVRRRRAAVISVRADIRFREGSRTPVELRSKIARDTHC